MQAFTKMSSTNWLFNEGFYLHSRITTSIFDSEAPFLFFHSIGWGEYKKSILMFSLEHRCTGNFLSADSISSALLVRLSGEEGRRKIIFKVLR